MIESIVDAPDLPFPSGRWTDRRNCTIISAAVDRMLPRLLALLIALSPIARQAQAGQSDWLLSDYVHTEWTHHDGVPLATLGTITQTTEGYLWILTPESGLLRFDGMRFVSLPTPCNDRVEKAAAGKDGDLWLKCGNRLLRRSARGEFSDVSPSFSWTLGIGPGVYVDSRGRVWVTSSAGRSNPIYVVASDGKSVREIHRNPANGIVSWAEDSEGVIWVTDRESVFRFRDDHFDLVLRLDVGALTAAPSGGVFGCSEDAVWHVRANSQQLFVRAPRDVKFACFSRNMAGSADSTLWIGTRQHGIALIHQDGRIELAPAALQIGYVSKVFLDREGSIWVGNVSGLHRYRARRVRLLSARARQLIGQPDAALVDSHDDLWIASFGGLTRVNNRTGAVRVVEGQVTALGEDTSARLWMATPSDVGYLANDRFVPARDETGRPVSHLFSFQLDSEGTLWGLSRGVGVYRLAPGLPRVVFPVAEANADLAVSPASGFWLTVHNRNGGGLMQLVPGRQPVLHTLPGMKPPVLIWSIATDGASVWVGGAGGLWRWRNGVWTRWGPEHGLPDDGDISEIAPDRSQLWLMTRGGITAVPRAQLDETPDGAARALAFARIGELDGVIALGAGPPQSPRVSVDSRGRRYFVTSGSVAIVEPSAVTEPSLKPIIVIESVSADGRAIHSTTAPRFVEPSLVQFEYTSLSLRNPENIRFRYMMEGYEAGWIEAGGRRSVSYGALGPGTYRFRVIGTGSEGTWNEEGATFSFQIAPVFWHTRWFAVLLVALATVMTFTVHRLRIRRLTTRLNVRFEAQLAERTRIARDLHDTLLQDACAALMQVELADVILTDAAATSPAIDPALPPLKKAVQVLSGLNTQGRATVHGLRELSASTDLTEALIRTAREQSNQQNIAFRVNLAGSPRALAPQIRAELYWIAREALANAYQHARARHIDVDLAYARAWFSCVVRDDGRGIDAGVLQRGREGHWGVAGMRERAQRVGAELEIRSVADGGTEVEFRIKGRLAYVHARRMDRVRQWVTQRLSDTQRS